MALRTEWIEQGGDRRPAGLSGDRRRSLGVALAALAIWLVALAPAVDAHGGTATLQLPTSHVNPGGTLELLGDMTGDGPVDLYLIAPDSVVRSLGSATADAEGHFQAFIALPSDLPTGSYEVAARSAIDQATSHLTIAGIPVPVGDEGQLPGRDDILAGSGAEPQATPVPALPIVDASVLGDAGSSGVDLVPLAALALAVGALGLLVWRTRRSPAAQA